MTYRILQGLDGKWYAVFRDAYDAEQAALAFEGCPIACFGQYDNAYRLN